MRIPRRWAVLITLTGAGILLFLAAPAARREILGETCSSDLALASVWVRALDARTGQQLSYELRWRSVLIVRDGDYADTTSLTRGAAYERPGTYDVVLRVPGYQEWTRNGVRAPQRLCAVRQARIWAELKPLYDSSRSRRPEGAPYIRGRIIARDAVVWRGFSTAKYPRILVEAGGSRENPPKDSTRPSERVWVILWDDTPIVTREGRGLVRNELLVGRTVSVWADGRKRDRDPGQAGASYIVVHDEMP